MGELIDIASWLDSAGYIAILKNISFLRKGVIPLFQGTMPSRALKIVSMIVKEWEVERIYVGCSGNFAIERTISNVIGAPITSNDVTIYSSYIGKFFSGEKLDGLRIKEDKKCYLPFLSDYMNTDIDKVATMILASDIIPYSIFDNAYCKRMVKAWEEQYPRVHKQLCEKLAKVKVNTDTFFHGDVMDMLDTIESDCGFVSFPPFFAGGYEKMWQNISDFFEYDEPNYKVFDLNKHLKLFCDKVKNLDNFLIGTERKVDEMAEYYVGESSTKAKEIYFYGKTKNCHFVRGLGIAKDAKPIIKINKEDSITENIEVHQIDLTQFNEIRALYLSTAVTKTGQPTAAFGFFCEGKLFGVFALSDSFMLGSSDKLEKPTIYLMTDFAVSPTNEKNLSKLVLYCILSKEVKLLAEKITGKQVNTISTNAFSKNPISMKYRGLFEQYGRRIIEKNEDDSPKKYNLSYGAKMGDWTIKEGYKLWRQK